jgi:hypothetical protein
MQITKPPQIHYEEQFYWNDRLHQKKKKNIVVNPHSHKLPLPNLWISTENIY